MRKSHGLGTRAALIPFIAPIAVLISLARIRVSPWQLNRGPSPPAPSRRSATPSSARTSQAVVMPTSSPCARSSARADGTERRLVAEPLAAEPNSWTQFAGWSPDGRLAIVGRGWESPENGRWEEEHKQFRHTAAGWLYDMFLVDLATGPGHEPHRRRPRQLLQQRASSSGRAIRRSSASRRSSTATRIRSGWIATARTSAISPRTRKSSPMVSVHRRTAGGSRITRATRSTCADADGSNARKIPTGQPFNFGHNGPPTASTLLFVSGEHYNCHPYVVNADGNGLRKLADRGGYQGVIAFLDVADFHGGSSDMPVWSTTAGRSFTPPKSADNVELFRVTLDGRSERLTPNARGFAALSPPAFAGRSLACLRIETGRSPATLRHAARGSLRTPHHAAPRRARPPCGRIWQPGTGRR